MRLQSFSRMQTNILFLERRIATAKKGIKKSLVYHYFRIDFTEIDSFGVATRGYASWTTGEICCYPRERNQRGAGARRPPSGNLTQLWKMVHLQWIYLAKMVIFHGFLLVYWRINQGMRRSRKMRATMSPSSISRPSLSSHMGNKNRRFQGSIHLAGYFEEGAHSQTETHTIHTYHIYI